MDLHYTDQDCLFWCGENLFEEQYNEKITEVWKHFEGVLTPVCGGDFLERKTIYTNFVENGGGLSPKFFCIYFSMQYWSNNLLITPVELDAISHAGYKVVLGT